MTTTNEIVLPHQECVFEAATESFATVCGMNLQQIPHDPAAESESTIIAVVSLVGDVEWSVFLGLPKSTAMAVAAKFAGFEIPYDSGDMGDAIGELTNIFAGAVKSKLDAKGVKANISLPSVIRAENMQILVQRHSTGVKTCFGGDLGRLWTGVISGKGGAFMA